MVKAKKAGLVAGIAAAAIGVAAAGAASYYFLGAKNADKNRKKAARWAKDLQKDVIKKAKKLKKIDEQAMRTIIDESVNAYTTLKDVSADDLQRAATELKSGWEHVAKEVRRLVRADKEKVAAKLSKDIKVVKKAVKTATKNVVPAVKKAAKANLSLVKKSVANKKTSSKKAAPKKITSKKK